MTRDYLEKRLREFERRLTVRLYAVSAVKIAAIVGLVKLL